MHVTLGLSETSPGDYLANFSSQGKLSSYSYAYFISRMLEGKVWIDRNRNGLQGSNEEELSGVQVTLMKLKDGGDKSKESDYEECLLNSQKMVGDTSTPNFILEDVVWLLPNQPITLPNTGGIGITIFYTIGILLTFSSTFFIGYFFYKKRKRIT